jgi:hypothetical protein
MSVSTLKDIEAAFPGTVPNKSRRWTEGNCRCKVKLIPPQDNLIFVDFHIKKLKKGGVDDIAVLAHHRVAWALGQQQEAWHRGCFRRRAAVAPPCRCAPRRAGKARTCRAGPSMAWRSRSRVEPHSLPARETVEGLRDVGRLHPRRRRQATMPGSCLPRHRHLSPSIAHTPDRQSRRRRRRPPL